MQKILVVVDMQNDFINGPLGTPEAQAIVPEVIEKIRKFEGDVIATLDTHRSNYLETREGKFLPVEHCIEGTEGHELQEEVWSTLSDKEGWLINKPTFASTYLVEHLRGKVYGDTEVTLIGVCTDICVVSNALLLKAYYPEMIIKVDASCCAGTTPENHEAALAVMRNCHIEVV